MAISISKLIGIHHCVYDFARELRFIATDDPRGDIRAAHMARKEAAEALKYEGFSDAAIEKILRRIEKACGI